MTEVRFRGRPPAPSQAFDAARVLGEALCRSHGVDDILVVVNDNRDKVLSWRFGPRSQISVHWALLPFPDKVVRVVMKEPGVWEELRKELPAAPLPPLRPQGQVHHLTTLLSAQRTHAPRAPELHITWGQWPRTPPRRSLRLGSCQPPLVRIHPVLDHPDVPSWFVGFVVFHEMLHAVHLPETREGRRILHTPSFRRAEARHPDYGRAQRFEKEQVLTWLRRCRDRVPRR